MIKKKTCSYIDVSIMYIIIEQYFHCFSPNLISIDKKKTQIFLREKKISILHRCSLNIDRQKEIAKTNAIENFSLPKLQS